VSPKWVKETLLDGHNNGKPYLIVEAGWGPAEATGYDKGHIPGALRALAYLADIWAQQGITKDKEVSFYCGTGWRSSLAWLAAYVMGWERIKNYDGSWYYWSMGPEKALNPVIDEYPNLP